MKSHDYKQLCHGPLKFCLRGILKQTQRLTLFQLLDVICDLCAEEQDAQQLDNLSQRVNIALALMERDWPISLLNITTHLLHHIVPLSIARFGPVYGTWMYVFERFNSFLCKRALNKRYPEASAVETYRLFEWVHFMRETKRMPDGYVQTHDSFVNAISSDAEKTVRTSHRDWSELSIICRQKFPVNAVASTCSKTFKYNCASNNCRYTCAAKQRCGTKSKSSYVYQLSDSALPFSVPTASSTNVRFGQIQYFVCNAVVGQPDVSFAKVWWSTDLQFDDESKLWHATNHDSQPLPKYPVMSFVTVGMDFSCPLVTAVEPGDDRLWFIGAGSKWPIATTILQLTCYC